MFFQSFSPFFVLFYILFPNISMPMQLYRLGDKDQAASCGISSFDHLRDCCKLLPLSVVRYIEKTLTGSMVGAFLRCVWQLTWVKSVMLALGACQILPLAPGYCSCRISVTVEGLINYVMSPIPTLRESVASKSFVYEPHLTGILPQLGSIPFWNWLKGDPVHMVRSTSFQIGDIAGVT